MRETTARLVQENTDLLEQGTHLIASMAPETYRNNSHDHFTSGIGKHMRHVLDVYAQVLDGAESQIDYDSRAREEQIETDPTAAANRVREVIEGLRAIADAPREAATLTVRTEILDADGKQLAVSSSLDRELAHLASHTVHHFAIIGLLARLQGVVPPKDFGVAPSTIRFQAGKS
jgi:uncharacterized damage-inducible protein DinB